MDKGTVVSDVAQVLRDAHTAGIANHVYILCGFPTETIAEFTQTIRFLDEHKEVISAVHRGAFTLESGSATFKKQGEFGITDVWLRRATPLGPRWGFRCAGGMSMGGGSATLPEGLAVSASVQSLCPLPGRLSRPRLAALQAWGPLPSRLSPIPNH